MEPLRELLGGEVTRLLLSPDGALNLVPFEALIDSQRRYLIERYAINYLTTGRDLLRLQVTRSSRADALVVADPLFGEPEETAAIGRVAGKQARRSVVAADDLSGVYFGPLVSTAREGRAIKALFPEATLLSGASATKAALVAVEAPRFLHIATHGFFLGSPAAVENPLLRSGLALSGANVGAARRGPGILTALEASNLNLWAPNWSRCRRAIPGFGEIKNGEGVYGLRRAFFLAGAETLVMSLWPVTDTVTREMMTAYTAGSAAASVAAMRCGRHNSPCSGERVLAIRFSGRALFRPASGPTWTGSGSAVQGICAAFRILIGGVSRCASVFGARLGFCAPRPCLERRGRRRQTPARRDYARRQNRATADR